MVDRQIAKVGAGAFSKAWKRSGGQAVLLSCHYDILDWVEPDWVFDTRTGELQRGHFGGGQSLTSKFSRQTARTGLCLSRITI